MLLDMHLPDREGLCPLIIFSHGFKGFKDWGTFELIASACASEGFCFVKFNFSHNGTTPERPTEFVDLNAFRQNTLSKELDDLGIVIDYLLGGSHEASGRIDPNKLYLAGHSRGGGISILKAAEDPRVKKLVTLGAVNNFGRQWKPEVVDKWRKEGVMEVLNSRTGQLMPLDYGLYDDYQKHLDRLYIPAKVQQMDLPYLIIHGRKDETVCIRRAYELNDWNKDCTDLFVIEDADHVFGGAHPWNKPYLPPATLLALNKMFKFLLN